MDKLLNNKKTIKIILAVLAGVIVMLGAVMMIVTTSGNSEASEKTETEETAAVEENVENTTVNRLVINNITDYAEEVYGCKVDDINNTASVVMLLETMGLEDIAGSYTVEIAPDGDKNILTVTAETVVKAETKRAYDNNMEICAQQLMALMPEIDQVTWTYPVTGSGDKQEKASVSVAAEAASNAVDDDIRAFGESKKDFEKLVRKQMKK